jgi:predicted protein tyrosine phosphatase
VIEVSENLFVGNEGDYEHTVSKQTGWAVLHACKEPYHRRLIGYTQRALPKEHPEYLFAERGHRLALNMIDGDDPRYTQHALIDRGISFIHKSLLDKTKILVHCNQGCSRSPSLGLVYLVSHTDTLPKTSLSEAEEVFRALYPAYQPMKGIRGYIEANWQRFAGEAHEEN